MGRSNRVGVFETGLDAMSRHVCDPASVVMRQNCLKDLPQLFNRVDCPMPIKGLQHRRQREMRPKTLKILGQKSITSPFE